LAIRQLLDAGRYADARAAAAAWMASIPEHSDPVTARAHAIALDALVEACWRNGESSPEVVAQAARAVTLWQTLSDLRATARSQWNLGRVLLLAWRPAEASAALESAVEALNGETRSDRRLLAEVLDANALALIELARYEEAERVLRRSLDLKERATPRESSAIARTLAVQSLGLVRAGQYDRARAPIDRALALWQAEPEHPDTATAFALHGDLLWLEGRPADARDAYEKCVQLAQRLLRPNHPDLANCKRRLGNTLARIGELAQALPLLEEARRLAEESLGPEHPFFSGYLNDLAEVHRTMMDYAKARALYEQGLVLRERRLGPNHQDLATIVFNLGLVSSELGDLLEARQYFDRAIAIWTARLGADHPFVALATASLAETLLQHGTEAEALSLQRRVLAIRERSLGPNHRETADALAHLARTLLTIGQISDASTLSARAMSIWNQADDSDSLGLAAVLTLRADVIARTGDLTTSRQAYERALGLTERVLGPDHPRTAEVRLRLGALAFQAGRRDAAFRQALVAERAAGRFLESTIWYLPEREALRYGAKRPSGLGLVLSLLSGAPRPDERMRRAALDTVIKDRSLVLDTITARRTTPLDLGPQDLAPQYHNWVAARQRLANLAVRGSEGSPPAVFESLIESARREAERFERILAEKSAAFKAQLTKQEVGVDEVQAALPSRSALVSFIRYDRVLRSESRVVNPDHVVPSFAAFVLTSTPDSPVFVPLGPASQIDSEVAGWRRAMTEIVGEGGRPVEEGSVRRAGALVKRRIWTPLEPYLRDADRVFVIPDGSLHLVNLAALPVGRSAYLIDDRRSLHYLTTERDIPQFAGPRPTGAVGLLAIGGVSFDIAPPVPLASSSTSASRSGCASFQSMHFDPLPGTLDEVRNLEGVWGTIRERTSESVRLLTGSKATEGAFKTLAPGRRMLHLATHGFFLGGDCASVAGARGIGALVAARRSTTPWGSETPLLLSGLVLAGANNRARAGLNEDDGILTAEEVAGLNLSGTEWAVLSACDTGLGAIQAGEGVFGLRRAFQLAGVRTVIMSLWAVDDLATRTWMADLYRARLQDQLDTAASMRMAALSLLTERRAKGLSTHPFFWAAFVAAGDWR
jgi:CHAT domain-containing protein/tetratricopeptide (TPR) repeat protein